ncbi:hypothetical protein DFJ77DRAFT_439189 [Powellomyces hirtus]|nr:hypothetical protein DFJ77DRAFT_439189 [Powellomyces hirtus]
MSGVFGILLLLTAPLLGPFILWHIHLRTRASPAASKTVLVLVLGDIGRSPRTQYHALSLATAGGCRVHLIGYSGTEPLPALTANKKIKVHYIPTPGRLDRNGNRLLYILQAGIRAVTQVVQVVSVALFEIPQPGFVLVQNPPAVPTLLLAQYLRFALKASLIIDWHNFGYSIMALSLGSQSPIVKFARMYEQCVGRSAAAHLCVSKAMAIELRSVWNVRGPVITLYDKAPSHFKRLSLPEIHAFTSRFPTSTSLFTTTTATGTPEYIPTRPALLVTSTSWTEDEDFDLLIDAMCAYDAALAEAKKTGNRELRRLVLVITGKGPLKQRYDQKIGNLVLEFVTIVTVWLPADQYPLLLGSADLGISLHTSSSGLDLPMKIVDMFGCGLPVCAIDYPCLHEVVTDNTNGRLFSTSDQLCAQLTELFDTSDAMRTLSDLRKGTKQFADRRWDEEWMEVVAPVFGIKAAKE